MEEDITPRKKSKWFWLSIVAGVLVVLTFIGSIGHFSGVGFFSYRTILYGSGEIYLLNLSNDPYWVSVDHRDPIKVEPQGAEITHLIGGTSVVRVFEQPNTARFIRHEIFTESSHAFLKVTGEGCLAAVDLTPFYGGGRRDEPLEFVARIEAEQQIWVPNSRNVVWPRRALPRRLEAGAGPGTWLEIVACELLDDESFLDAYLAIRLEERFKASQE